MEKERQFDCLGQGWKEYVRERYVAEQDFADKNASDREDGECRVLVYFEETPACNAVCESERMGEDPEGVERESSERAWGMAGA